MKIDPIIIVFALALIAFGGFAFLFTSSTQSPTANVTLTTANNFQTTQNQVAKDVVLGGPGEVVEIKTVIQNFRYNPDTITVKRGSTVRLTIENKDNVVHGLHLPQFGIQESQQPLNTITIEFIAVETPSNGQAVPTCSQEHGETLTFNIT